MLRRIRRTRVSYEGDLARRRVAYQEVKGLSLSRSGVNVAVGARFDDVEVGEVGLTALELLGDVAARVESSVPASREGKHPVHAPKVLDDLGLSLELHSLEIGVGRKTDTGLREATRRQQQVLYREESESSSLLTFLGPTAAATASVTSRWKRARFSTDPP